MDYQKQAQEIATKLGIKLTVKHESYGKHFTGDTQNRYIFKCRLSRGRKSYTFKFGQSIAAGSEEPTMYDVLSVMTKYDPESFDYFCRAYGYDFDDDNAKKTYKSVQKEWDALDKMFTEDELELLRDT